jgi:hypothetical protein
LGLYNARALLSGPFGRPGAQVAQLVEHVTENHGVGGSIPPLGTTQQTLNAKEIDDHLPLVLLGDPSVAT